MDATQTLVDATRRYLAGDLTLPELADIEASLVHLWPRLPADNIGSRLMGAIEQCLAFMDDGVGTEDDLMAELERELAIIAADHSGRMRTSSFAVRRSMNTPPTEIPLPSTSSSSRS